MHYQCKEVTPGNYRCTTDFYNMCTPDATGVACVQTYHRPVCRDETDAVTACPKRQRGRPPPPPPTETKPELNVSLFDGYGGSYLIATDIDDRNLEITGRVGGEVRYTFTDSSITDPSNTGLPIIQSITLSKLHDAAFTKPSSTPSA